MKRKAIGRKFLVGWQASAVALLTAAAVFTIILCSLLLASLFNLGNGWTSLNRVSLLFSGSCNDSSRLNLGLHLLINIISSGILASSNFFMQILLAPTRHDIDKAHARSRFAEVGVQSFRNLRIVRLSNVVIWVLLATTSVPLHLVFNSCVLESRGSTKFLMVVASEGFTKGENYLAPGVGEKSWYPASENLNSTLIDIQKSVSSSTWERLSLVDCWKRYNDTRTILTDYRHVVLVISNQNESLTAGWTAGEVHLNITADDIPPQIVDVRNSLWFAGDFDRTDSETNERAQSGDFSSGYSPDDFLYDNFFHLYPTSGLFALDTSVEQRPWLYETYNNVSRNPYNEPYQNLQAQYCLSEPITIQCKLEVENSLLGIVCLVCIVKCILCAAILLKLRNTGPLATLGDAIESFILNPDATTTGMCSLSRGDFAAQEKTAGGWHSTTASWNKSSRRSMIAVPRFIWSWSYILITLSIGTSLFFLVQAIRTRPIAGTFFGHDPRNPNVYIGGLLENAEHGPKTATLSILANLPQLILSVCYLAYNGLLTRIFSEFEWASYSQNYIPLRVTQRKGDQRSTYRLQLPFRWSIPLLVISAFLHWLASNCIYIIIYEGHDAFYPYATSSFRWLQFSSVAILISLLVCILLATVPVILGFRKLPGQMVVAGNCSAVISAACHCVTEATSRLLPGKGMNVEILGDESEDALWRIATGKVKWGVVSSERRLSSDGDEGGESTVGHLSFGLQDVEEPEEGRLYAG